MELTQLHARHTRLAAMQAAASGGDAPSAQGAGGDSMTGLGAGGAGRKRGMHGAPQPAAKKAKKGSKKEGGGAVSKGGITASSSGGGGGPSHGEGGTGLLGHPIVLHALKVVRAFRLGQWATFMALYAGVWGGGGQPAHAVTWL